jgi:nicotinamide-nucleotide adenylyltransferase
MPNSLYIGRFQPFHLGHLSVCKKIIDKGEFLIIGIGSAEDNFLPENPFTASERWGMITLALEEAKISKDKYTIIPVRNINNYALWVQHISLILPPFEKIYTGSKIVKELFKKDGRYEICNVEFKHKISATKVRELIKKNDKKWEKLVPKNVCNFLKRINSIEKL